MAPAGSQGSPASTASSRRDNPGGIAAGIWRTVARVIVGGRQRRIERSLGRLRLVAATTLAADLESSSPTHTAAGSVNRRRNPALPDSPAAVGRPAAPQPACGILPVDSISAEPSLPGSNRLRELRPGEVASTLIRGFEHTEPEFYHTAQLVPRIHRVQRRRRRRRSAPKTSGRRNRVALWAKDTPVEDRSSVPSLKFLT